MSIQGILDRLEEGNLRFVEDKLDGKLQDSVRREQLTGGQEPYAIVLSCADSRVVPELAFDTGLGELFVVRVAGNIANTSSLGSIEYAVLNCKSKVIVVLGHESCGAVTAAMAGGDNGANINHLVKYIQPAVDANPKKDAKVNDVVRTNAKLTAQALIDNSPVIKTAVDAKTVKIVPAYYNLDTGKVDFL